MFHCLYVLLFACKLNVLGSGIYYAAASVVVAMSGENLFGTCFFVCYMSVQFHEATAANMKFNAVSR